MKTISLTIILLGLFATMLKAQPVLTKANTQIVYLDAWTVIVTDDRNAFPGNSGANQNWDLSGLTSTGSKWVEVLGPSVSPYSGGSYYKADRAFKETVGSTTVWTYFKTTDSSLEVVGIRDWTKPPSFCLNDYWDWMRYSLQYGDVFSDSFSTKLFPYCDGVDSIMGTSTLNYDGYGMLTTPTGIFPNVARLKLNAYYISRPDNFGPADTFTIEVYRWYQPGIHYPIAKISTIKKNSSAPVTTGEYFSSITKVGIDEKPGAVSGLSVFPVPANDRLHLSFNSKRADDMHITVTDISGRVLIEQTVTSLPSSSLVNLNIAQLQPGNYMVRLTTAEQCETRKFVKY